MIDRLGKCPNCGMDWKGKDIKEALNNLDIFSNKIDATVDKAAAMYGWTGDNPAFFTKATIMHINDVMYIKCPSFDCGHIFNVETEEEYKSGYDLIHSVVKEEKVETGYKLGKTEIEGAIFIHEDGSSTTVMKEDDCPFEAPLSKLNNIPPFDEAKVSDDFHYEIEIKPNESSKQEGEGDNTDRRRESRNRFFAALRKQE